MDVPGNKGTRSIMGISAARRQANPRTNILNELLKIDNGRISFVQTVMLLQEAYGTKSGWN
jgi:hypothetical protein